MGRALSPDTFPARPAREFTKMKAAETPADSFAPAQFLNSNSGVRKMPPPDPVSPESSPIPAPDARAEGSGIDLAGISTDVAAGAVRCSR